jgi:Ca-activated chloride channel family protein
MPWKITANIKCKSPISTVYSASHKVYMNRVSDNEVSVKIEEEAQKQPGAFRLSYLLEKNPVTASMFAYPDEKLKGGYFLLLAGLPADVSKAENTIKREVTIVIDHSGSMRNEKIGQVKEAALQVIAGLKEGEAFNIIIYSNTVEKFSEKPVIKNAETAQAAQKYIEGITATGGTNIYDALKAALEQQPTKDMLPIVLFLTDGLPTVGNTSEVTIRELATKANPYKRRIFTFGVGFDVNAPLLQRIAEESRAKAEFVQPKEDVEVKVGKVFKSLSGPVLADTKLEVLDKDGRPALGRVRDILPAVLPDMFEGDQLILAGQFVGNEPIQFRIGGNFLGKERTFKFTFEFDKADVRNGFVSRLWASRKIAELIDAVRQMGAEPGVSTSDPKVKELVDEIVKLSTEFGILTEYTAFLAREGTDISDRIIVSEEAARNFDSRAIHVRAGKGAFNQSFNTTIQKEAKQPVYGNTFFNEEMERVTITNVQQINDRAFYNKGNKWIDSRVAEKDKAIKPDRVIEFGSPEYFELAERLAKVNRQASMAFSGEVIIEVDGKVICVKMPRN